MDFTFIDQDTNLAVSYVNIDTSENFVIYASNSDYIGTNKVTVTMIN